MDEIKTLSLFSGAGGLDIGFRKARYDIRASVEIESSYCATLQANHGTGLTFSPSETIHCQDIRTFDARKYLDAGIECVIGGPPCQTFSAAGRRSGGVLGTSDLRGRLFESYCDVLDILKPKAFIFENVYGLPGANGGGPWREICEAFSSLGYTLSAEVLDAADYGVPQHRERLFIVGVLNGKSPFRFPAPTHGPDSMGKVPLTSIRASLSDLQSDEEPYHQLDGLYGHLLAEVPEGLNYSFFTQEMGYPEPRFAWRSKFHDFLYKVDPDSPARTIKAQPGKFTGPFHWKNRHFTEAELKRLQTFPDTYKIVGSFSKVMEQIGNSVPPRLAEVLATSLRDQILRPVKTPKFSERPTGFKSTFRQRQRERTNHFKEVAAKEISIRFPKLRSIKAHTKQVKKSFFISFEGRYDKTVGDVPLVNALGQVQFQVASASSGGEIVLDVIRLDNTVKSKMNVEIHISGLKKYLLSVETLKCHALVAGLEDLFKVWDIIQTALIEKSQFFTLIDIYGHYANRGDVVDIETKLSGKRLTTIEKAVNFFGNSAHCGQFLADSSVASALNIEEELLPDLLKNLRELRWDVRDETTHSTITQHGILCTYPFPLLSSKAQFDRKQMNASAS